MGTQNAKVWLVTGCSTGLGRYIDEHLLEAGEKGVVTARKTDKVADFQRRSLDPAPRCHRPRSVPASSRSCQGPRRSN